MNHKNRNDVNYVCLNLLEKAIFRFAWDGWRGSHFLWRVNNRIKHKGQQDKRLNLLPNGFVMSYEAQDWTKRTIYEGTYERALLHFLESLSKIELVIDVGANIGVTLWQTLKGASQHAKFIAFEPSEQCLGDLETLATQLKNDGEIIQAALGEREGLKELFGINNKSHSGLASLVNRPVLTGESKVISMQTLDSVLKSRSLTRTVSVLKIDTEGYEREVLIGSSSLLESKRVEILILEVSPNFGETSYLKNLANQLGEGYLWFQIVEKGHYRRRAWLQEISVECALEITYQFNLVLFRRDKLEEYRKDPKAIKMHLSHNEQFFG